MGKPATVLLSVMKGLEMRDTKQATGQAEFAINADYNRGVLEARKAFAQTGDDTSVAGGRMHVFDRPGMQKYLLVVGREGTDPLSDACYVSVHNEYGTQLEKTNFVDEVSPVIRCSFVDTFLAGNPVTLVYLRKQVLLFSPNVSNTLRVLTTADARRVNSLNFGYWDTNPYGPIACNHNGAVATAGYQLTDSVALTNPLEQDQTQLPEGYVAPGRGGLLFSPTIFCLSDYYDAAGIPGIQFFAVEEGEEVTGLKSFQDMLFVFTDKGIHVLAGTKLSDFVLQRVVTGYGCVSHESIVEAKGKLYYAAADGIYVFGGMANPVVEKLSDPISPLFESVVGDWLPPAVTTVLSRLSTTWPFKTGYQEFTRGRLMPLRDEIWWSVPDAMTGLHTISLIYNLTYGTWSIWCMEKDAAGNGGHAAFTDAVELSGQIFSTSWGTTGLLVQQGFRDYVSRTVPFVWVSGRVMSESDVNADFRDVRLHCYSKGCLNTVTVGMASDQSPWGGFDELGVPTGRPVITSELGCTHPLPNSMVAWGGKKWGASVVENRLWCGADLFAKKFSTHLSGRWVRVYLLDAPGSVNVPNVTILSSISVEVASKGDSK